MTETAGPVAPAEEEGPPTVFLTFLIADVRGYTRFTVENGSQAAARLAMRFATLAKEHVSAHEGKVIELRGDEALAVFASPQHAILAATELQQRFRAEMDQDPSLPLKVGIGVDAGDVVPVEEGYRGLALNLAARLCSLASAGEVYGTEGLIQHAQKLSGLVYVERGRVGLKGFADPVRVIQILPERELPAGFPPLVSLIAKPSNLPLQSTPFVGREAEVAAVTQLMRRPDVRLLTLTGPGGIGKTRLALQVASAVLDDFERGAFFVPLASVGDASLVASAIATTLRVKESPGLTLIESLKEYLRDREMLLFLDNFEHVLDAAPLVAELLRDCPGLNVLVTSRASLHLTGEHDYAVPTLSVPSLDHADEPDDLLRHDAISLFVERAQAVRSDFVLTRDNARSVAEICTGVDGLPLAIELAAARIRVFPPELLAQRLGQRLRVLTGGARDLPTRQQTLRATIDWSYSLLDTNEQRLFAWLSVFAGGCDLPAAEAVCNPDGTFDLANDAASLADKSLLRRDGDEDPRYLMLQTIREYALGRLEEGSNVEPLRARHAAYYLTLAEQAQPAFRSADHDVWLDRLEPEHDNMRAALAWALEDDKNDLALRLTAALRWFWIVRGYQTEGRRWLDEALARSRGARVPAQVGALIGAGWFAQNQGDLDVSARLLEEAADLAAELQDDAGRAEALNALGRLAIYRGDYEHAEALNEESLDLYLSLGDTWGVAAVTNDLGCMYLDLANYDRAQALLDEALALSRPLGQKRVIGILLFNLGYVAWCRGEQEEARQLYEQSVEICREAGEKVMLAMALGELGLTEALRGQWDRSAALMRESLQLDQELGHQLGVAEWLENQAKIASIRGEPSRAARLHGAAHALRETIGAPLSPSDQKVHARDLSAARSELGDQWDAEWDAGRQLTANEAIALSLGEK
jgi:predicted ATPase/class 3 adenylate cyclase